MSLDCSFPYNADLLNHSFLNEYCNRQIFLITHMRYGYLKNEYCQASAM